MKKHTEDEEWEEKIIAEVKRIHKREKNNQIYERGKNGRKETCNGRLSFI